MWGKRFVVSVGIMAMVLVIAAGCGRPAAQKKNPAQERAVAFYRSFFLGGDLSAAYDMAIPGFWDNAFKSKEEFFKYHTDLQKRITPTPNPNAELDVEEHARAGDFLYIVSDSTERQLIWVTKTSQGWMVRDFTEYKGGPIPWSRGG